MLIAAQQLDAGRSVEKVFQFGHDLELGIGVRGTSGTYLCHDFVGGALVVGPSAEELVHFLCYALTTCGLGLSNAFCQAARQGKTLTRRETLGLCPYIVYLYAHNCYVLLFLGCKFTNNSSNSHRFIWKINESSRNRPYLLLPLRRGGLFRQIYLFGAFFVYL